MACYFSDFGFVRIFLTPFRGGPSFSNLRINKSVPFFPFGKFFTPSEGGAPFGDCKQEKIYLSRVFLAFLVFGYIPISIADGPFSSCPSYTDTVRIDNFYQDRYSANAACLADAAAGINPGCGTWDLFGPPRSATVRYNIGTSAPYSVTHTPVYAVGLWYYAHQCWDFWIYHYPPTACPAGTQYTGPDPGSCQPLIQPKDLGSSCKNPVSALPQVGNPCNAATGNKYQPETDTLGNGTALTRHYNSLAANADGSLGYGWTTSALRRLQLTDATHLLVSQSDGRGEPFVKNAAGQWQGDADTLLSLQQDGSGFTLSNPDGSVERYDLAGKILSNTDRAGQVTTYGYDASGRVGTLTDPFGRVLTFGYDANNHVASVTDSSGKVTSYGYDANKNLTQVTFPDGTGKLYHYENTSFLHHLTGISYVSASGTVTRYATYAYDTNGLAISTEHASGQEKATLAYDSATQTTVTDGVGTKKIFTFAPNLGVKNLTALLNLADGKVLNQTFDANNNLTCKQDEEGHVTTWTYNATNQKTAETRGQGGNCSAPVPTSATRTTTYQYLSSTLDLPTRIETPSVAAGNFKTVTISYSGNLPSSITQSGFTPSGTAVSRTVSLGYNANGQVTSIDGPRADVADVTTLAYNNCTTGGGCGQLQRVTNALGHVTTYDSYDANGRLLQMTDPNGVRTVYTYDPRGRVWSITQSAPGGSSRVTTYGYDAAGNVTSTTLPTGLSLTYTYDAAQYLRRVTDSLGNYIDYGYDLKGNRTQTYTYDASGTLVRTVDLAFDARNRVSEINAGGSITKQISDAVGNLTKITDPNTVAVSGTAATNNNYDALNRLFQTVDRLSGSTLYGYDANDRLKTVQAPNGASTQYQYDDLGNLLQETSPDRGTVRYAYDAAGNLVQQTDARGVVSAYAYDALNRLTRIDYGSSVENVTYTYDSASGCTFGLGRLCSVVDESGGTAYAYDAFGNVLVQTHAELGITYNTFYTYDAGNRVMSITYPDSRMVSYQRDVLGRITSVATSVNGTAVTVASARSFRPDGLLLGQSFGNGLNELRQYDTQGRLTYQSLGNADTRLYSYDANGNLKGLQSLPLVGSYNYDALDRLSLDQRTTTATTSSTFTYDANGNRQSENLGTYAYLTNSNRLSTTPSGGITLDAAGNTLSDGTRSYTYNNARHLSTVAGAGYSYNAQRLRSRKIVGSQGTVYHYDLGGNLIAESDTTGVLRRSYVWADGQALAQIEPVTTLPPDIIVDDPQAAFTGFWFTSIWIPGYYGNGFHQKAKGTGNGKATWNVAVPSSGTYQVYVRHVTSGYNASNAPFTVNYAGGSQTIIVNQRTNGGQWISIGNFPFTAGTAANVTLTDNANGTVIADAVKLVATSGGTTSEVVRYLHSDHLNTPRLATNGQALVIWRWEGTAFGQTAPNEDVDGDGKLTTINLRFPGQYYDAESGLHYNWNRYYDPRIGRYVTSDPIGLAGGFNTYAYVTNNPLIWMDPWGLDRLINPTPAGPGGPSITLLNDVPGGPSVNLPVSDATADMIENAVIQLGLDININSTSGGIHDPSSRHPKGMACDISKVGGRPVSPSNQDAQRLQEILHGLPNIRENFGPFIITKSLSDTVELHPEQASQHQTHIHASGQR